MARPLSRKNCIGALVGAAVVLLGAAMWCFMGCGVKTWAEVILWPLGENEALAANGRGELFTFTLPEGAPEALPAGTVILLTGPDYWLYSSPMVYPEVEKVKVEEENRRPDFVALYYQQLAELAPADRALRIQELADLNAGEKAGLAYLLEMNDS